MDRRDFLMAAGSAAVTGLAGTRSASAFSISMGPIYQPFPYGVVIPSNSVNNGFFVCQFGPNNQYHFRHCGFDGRPDTSEVSLPNLGSQPEVRARPDGSVIVHFRDSNHYLRCSAMNPQGQLVADGVQLSAKPMIYDSWTFGSAKMVSLDAMHSLAMWNFPTTSGMAVFGTVVDNNGSPVGPLGRKIFDTSTGGWTGFVTATADFYPTGAAVFFQRTSRTTGWLSTSARFIDQTGKTNSPSLLVTDKLLASFSRFFDPAFGAQGGSAVVASRGLLQNGTRGFDIVRIWRNGAKRLLKRINIKAQTIDPNQAIALLGNGIVIATYFDKASSTDNYGYLYLDAMTQQGQSLISRKPIAKVNNVSDEHCSLIRNTTQSGALVLWGVPSDYLYSARQISVGT